MSSKMLQFVATKKAMPAKRTAESRVADFNEIYNEFKTDVAETQASRCSQCGVPFCQVNCPLHNNIPDWLMMTAQGRMREAYELSAQTNNFPEICGRICPQDRLCEGSCVIEKGFESVTIGAVEKHITETAFNEGWVKPATPRQERCESIGIIGAGPAGLAAAEMLRHRGYQVHVYDRYDRIGGLLIYGIPGFKLEKEVVERRGQLLRDGGVIFHLGVDVGAGTHTFANLQEEHDAILIATGVYKARDINLPGVGLPGIVPALDYLTASNRKSLGDLVPAFENGMLDAAGKDVVVIGGGDTAMDCVRTAIRQRAKSVSCLYRRDRANMPGSQREVQNAEEEGVVFNWLSAPEAFIGENKVQTVCAQRIHLGQPDSTGRQVPEIIDDSSYDLPADLVIKALGFDAESLPKLFDQDDLEVTRWGTVKIDWQTMMTTLDGVFAAGDIIRGASLVVWGVRDGRDAAEQIDRWVTARVESSRAVSAGN